MAKRKRDTQRKDQLSELPEAILHKILTLLPVQEAIATTLLSKAWRYVWITNPCLDLGENLFLPLMKQKLAAFTDQEAITKKMFRDNVKKQFFGYVDQTITKRFSNVTSSIEILRLYVPNTRTRRNLALSDGWIMDAINNFRLEELAVSHDFAKWVPYKLPGEVFVASSLVSLKRLSLSKIQLDQETIECLATSCPLVEKLCFNHCFFGLVVLKVSGFSKLDEFVIHDDLSLSELVVNAPNLGSFEYERKVLAYNKPPIHINVTSSVTLRYLRLYSVKCSWTHQFVKLLSNVEQLELVGVHWVPLNFVISSNCLKSCILDSYFSDVNIKAPNLKHLWVTGLGCSSYVINSSAIETCCFRIYDKMTMAELVDFLMKHKFSSFEKLEVLVSSLLQNLTIPSHLIKASNNLLYDVKYLILRIGDKLHSWESYGVHEVLNSLLWICPNPQTISLCSNAVGKYAKLYYCNLKVLKFKYFKPGEKGADKCSRCESLPVLCWQHYLQEVTIDSRGGEYEKTVKSFQRKRKARTKDDEIIKAFFENAREEEKILVHIIR